MTHPAHYEFVDPSFRDLTGPDAPLVKIFDQCIWSEGPVWFADGGYLLWSDIPNNRMLRFVPDHGVSTFRSPSNFINGNTRDLQGRLVSCSHGARAVLRTEYDGTITTLADRYDGKRLNSPNDVVVKSDGTIWFTDPSYGIDSNHEGYKSDSEQTGCHVYRFDPADGSLVIVADDFEKPNGLAFSPDESTLYVSDTGRTHRPGYPAHIRMFDLAADNTLANPRVFIDADSGLPDGFRLDTMGNIWTSAGPNVNVYNPAGALLGRIILGTSTSNVTFGGPNRSRLFITSSQFVYSLDVAATGLQRP
ncbi:SMP-30/gluconolactonase/LRE family protein [Devosia sp.]|uniref:SMP-30/gluconolactonase/LRE family protein n=1 Tax=Devosia sp. TaxID=1871048 RepID=UPI0032669D0C